MIKLTIIIINIITIKIIMMLEITDVLVILCELFPLASTCLVVYPNDRSPAYVESAIGGP
jgi:hypothetical protein